MNFKRLLAKSRSKDLPKEAPDPESMKLQVHLDDVHRAAGQVLDATGDDQLRALGLAPDRYRERFRRLVLLAAAVHDLGKANDHFQGMIHGTRDVRTYPQGVRHEWVTLLMLRHLREWLLPAVGGSDVDFAIVEWAVAGHHPAHDHASPPRLNPAGAGAVIEFLMGHNDFRAALLWLKGNFQIGEPPLLANTNRNLVGAENVFAEIVAWAKAARRTWDDMNDLDKRLVAAVKDCLVAADIAGSALPKKLPDVPQRWLWISDSFATIPSADDLEFLAQYALEGNVPRGFQTEVANHPDEVVFVKAGCGSGKTTAAYMRAAEKWAGRRLYFCYPTTGTATEGFKDYLYPEMPEKPEADTPEKAAVRARVRALNADLFHSRRTVDFDIILGTGKDAPNPEADETIRIESLDAWSTPIVACTIDTVLGIVQNNKRGLFAWPALAQSAFVFDEIHAYDDRLFGALLRFLRDLPGLPSLLMTASLPKAREEALRTLLMEWRGIELTPIPGPKALEELPRYKIVTPEDNDPLPLVRETLQNGGKVLWVCNTVKRVMDAADRTSDCSPLIYHSRFTDRRAKTVKLSAW